MFYNLRSVEITECYFNEIIGYWETYYRYSFHDELGKLYMGSERFLSRKEPKVAQIRNDAGYRFIKHHTMSYEQFRDAFDEFLTRNGGFNGCY